MSGAVNSEKKALSWTDKLEVIFAFSIRKKNLWNDNLCKGIQREEEKVKRSLKEAAKKGDKDVCMILAKEVLRARKAISKIYTSKAHINSISMQMKNQLGISSRTVILKVQLLSLKLCTATLRIAGSLQRSTEVMKAMQQLIKIPEVAATMRDLSKEMMKVFVCLIISLMDIIATTDIVRLVLLKKCWKIH